MKHHSPLLSIFMVAVLPVGVASAALLRDMSGHWSASLIAALSARGVVSGDLSGRYNPDQPLARAEMAKLFAVSLGRERDAQVLSDSPSRFSDVPKTHWGNGYIEALAEIAVAEGYGDLSFGPNDPVSRAQMAVFLVRAAGLVDQAIAAQATASTYADDAQIPAWARGYVVTAQSEGLMIGFVDGTFGPTQPISRAEGGVALLRLMVRKGTAYHMVGTLVQFDVARGEGTVRDELGKERTFALHPEAQFFRSGKVATAAQIQLLDPVWIVLGSDGTVRLIDARHIEVQR